MTAPTNPNSLPLSLNDALALFGRAWTRGGGTDGYYLFGERLNLHRAGPEEWFIHDDWTGHVPVRGSLTEVLTFAKQQGWLRARP